MRFAPAVLVSVGLVVAGPVIGQLRSTLQAAFPNQYRTILVGLVASCLGAGFLAAIVRIRTHKAERYGLLAAALAIGVTYALATGTGDPAIDAVERFHFVEYGVITALFYFAWRPVADLSLFALPVVAGLLVGTVEEWLQWFVPARVGEARDVFLNLAAIVCGLLFSVALAPPVGFSPSFARESWRRVRRLAAAALLVFASFFHCVHLGYEIRDPEAGIFRSTYDDGQLRAIAGERALRWRSNPPLAWSRYSREDQYFSEGLSLVRLRNRCWDAGDVSCAWRTNLVLERYYAPVIDTPSYVSAAGLRWPAAQRADAAERARQGTDRSAALEHETILVTWSKPMFWGAVALVMAVLLVV